jgi:TPR repeat protein
LAVVLVALTLSRCSGAPPIRDCAREAKESLENLIENAEQGGVAAQVSLGLRYKHGMRVPQDFGEALKWFLRASRQGNAFAQACLGAMYRDGLGVAQDYREAGKWFRKSADQGDSTAQLALGILYKEGKGVPRDDEEALKWLNSAMEDRPAFPRGPFDYWNIPPILPSPITPIQIGEARRRVGEWKPRSWEELKREEEKRQP